MTPVAVGLYFLVGVLQDALIARYYLSLTRHRTVLAPALGALITVLTVAVFDALITSRSILGILAYGLGTGLGTRLGMSRTMSMSGTPPTCGHDNA